jgi:hypothetical protein
MGTGTLTLACVLLTAGAGAEPETYHINRPKMAIPIEIVPARRNDLREILLFCSRDEGKTWTQEGRATPEQTSFPFTAPADGKYWFTIQTVDRNGARDPVDVYAAPVGQRVVVDTVKPLVRVKAERKGDEIVASWEVTEDYPKPSTFVLEYHLADQPAPIWAPVAATPGATGTATFKPSSPAAVTVQVRVKDQAENEGAGVAEVPGVAPAGGPPAPEKKLSPAWSEGPPVVPPPPPTATGAPTAAAPMRGALPGVQLVNKKDVKLDFDVTKLGPSGLGAVEVYVTTDDGASWNQVPLGADAVQPPEARGPGQARGSVVVSLADDAKVYGFYLVVKCRANLGKPAPKSGDAPHVRVERDTVPPHAELNFPKADPNRRDTLLLTWTADDKNLTATPVTLEWAPRKDGPWEFIGAPELPNTGRYAWQVPANVPPSVYLKLTVRDGAGNVAVAVSPEPQTVDLSVPEVGGVSVSPR